MSASNVAAAPTASGDNTELHQSDMHSIDMAQAASLVQRPNDTSAVPASSSIEAQEPNEQLPFGKNYRPWNRGLKETQSKISTRPNRPDAPVLWAEDMGSNYTTKDALTAQSEGQDAAYGAIKLPELMKPFKTREAIHAIPALERIGTLLRNLANSMMLIIEEDNRHMWSIEHLQAILQGDDTESEALALDANDRNIIKCKDVTQDFINVRKAYIDAISLTRQRIIHLIQTRQWLVSHFKEVERNDKQYVASKRDTSNTK